MFRKGFLLILSFMLITGYLLVRPAYAFVLDPSTGEYATGVVETFELVAKPTGDYSEAYVRLKTKGAIVNYVDPDSTDIVVLGACNADGAKLLPTDNEDEFQICINISKLSGDLVDGDSLGKLTLQSISEDGNVVTVVAESGSGYAINGDTDPVTGNLGSFAFGNVTVPPDTLPETGLLDLVPVQGLLGLALVSMGIGSMMWAMKFYVYDRRVTFDVE